MKNPFNRQEFIGKGKKEIIRLMGSDEFNYYPSQIWSYYLRKNWLGQSVFLLIYFEDDIVVNIGTVKKFKK